LFGEIDWTKVHAHTERRKHWAKKVGNIFQPTSKNEKDHPKAALFALMFYPFNAQIYAHAKDKKRNALN